ncbi:MAG: hypothetical protein JWQ88_1119 [Rhodoferax sp.]|nr:hypothetical protein [Rhodoferax sp.]
MTPPSPHRPPFPAPRLQRAVQRAGRHVVPRAVGALCLLLMTAAAAQAAGDAHSPISPSTSAASAASTASSPPATSATPAAPAIGRIQLPARPVVQPKGEGQARTEPATPSEPGKREAGGRGAQLREAIEKANSTQSGAAAPPPAQFTFTVPPDKKAAPAARAATRNVAGEATAASTSAAGASSGSSARTEPPVNADEMSRQYIRARAAALGAFAATPQAAAAVGMKPVVRTAGAGGAREPAPRAAHGAALPWGYEGAGGPLSWGQLKPEYAACAAGQRQSPIAIDDSTALLGPAEPLAIEHQPSTGTVVHTGRTLRVDVKGANALTVRGKRYVLEQIEFHQPAEERINGKGFAMSAHLLHRAADGQMAMVAVLLEPGTASPLVDQVVTYLPLDVDDRVGLPPTGLDLAGLLPQDARYYQFFGSLSAPPCTEDVLWIVFKQPMTVSASQLKLFGQLFPNNARPLQPLNGRVVRAAQ